MLFQILKRRQKQSIQLEPHMKMEIDQSLRQLEHEEKMKWDNFITRDNIQITDQMQKASCKYLKGTGTCRG